MRRLTMVLAAAFAACSAGALRAQQNDTFPHQAHAKVFPACTGCHAGIATGDVATSFPDPATCNGCHDGQQQANGKTLRVVNWRAGKYAATNLDFSHVRHAKETNTTLNTTACVACHQIPGTTEFMAVAGPAPSLCLACHEHAAGTHLAEEAKCRSCHVPLAQATALTVAQIAGFPKPASHEGKEFIFSHQPSDSASVARCAVCHTQESCARCHMDATTNASIIALGSNAVVAQAVAGKGAYYPVPASHGANDFAATHGAAALKDGQSCAGCHAQASCKTCHLQKGAKGTVVKLPVPQAGGAQGVQLRSASDFALLTSVAFRAPAKNAPVAPPKAWAVRVHVPGFNRDHRAAAAGDSPNCASCHQQAYCADCHDGVGRIKYHPPDFVQGHGAQAYGREQDCGSCHNAQAFCLSCHQNLGLGSTGQGKMAVHNQSPNWLLDHGQAARLSLPNCVSCHKQSDCIACHATTTWGINPHGPNFNADLMANRNSQICYYCHTTNPVNNRTR